MPFRTKDFLVFLLAVAFLLVGITATVQGDIAERSSQSHSALVVLSEEVTFEAVLPETTDIDRKGRLATFRDKIAALVLDTPEAEEAAVAPEETPEVEDEVNLGAVLYCPRYTSITPVWTPAGLKFEVVEGARLVYREVASAQAAVSASGTVSTVLLPSREVVLQLPLRGAPLANKTCISTDVVGIGTDGSLIRNNEQALYRVFGSETLIGYALDGFPIYGVSTAATDECGGSSISGEYRYYLNTEREGVLGCFGGLPVTL